MMKVWPTTNNQDIKIFLFLKNMPDYGWSGSLNNICCVPWCYVWKLKNSVTNNFWKAAESLKVPRTCKKFHLISTNNFFMNKIQDFFWKKVTAYFNTINCNFIQILTHICGIVKISKQLTRKMCNSYLERNTQKLWDVDSKQLPSVDL